MSNRQLTDDEKRARANQLHELAENITQHVLDGLHTSIKTCITCEFWLESEELCTNKTNCPQSPARPPAKIIAYGCDHYRAGVPF